MMCPDHGTIDHIGAGIARHHLGQGLQQSIEHAHLDPAPIAPEHTVPFAIFIREQPPLRTRPRHPHHPLEVAPVVAGRAAATAMLGRQQRADQRPLVIRYPNTLAQSCLQKTALNQIPSLRSSFVHEP